MGASERANSIGTRIFRNLKASYQGPTYPVNAFRRIVDGCKAYPSIDRVPSKVDLAIIATPAHTVPQVIEECGNAGVQNAVIVSAGFDSDGDLAKRILGAKQAYNIRILGPNSYGLIRPSVGLYATFAREKAVPGKIAFLSQSGALCGSALDWSAQTQVGLSAVVSLGSSIDVDFGDLIDFFGTDRQTRLIMLYVESIKNIRKFMSAARGYARSKPIVLVKTNRFHALSYESANHDSIQTALFDAAFRRSGIVEVESVNDLFNCGKTLLMRSSPTDPNLTIITNAGGPALMATQQLLRLGGKLAKPSGSTIQRLKSILPSYCGFENPMDILEEATSERYKGVIEACLDDNATRSLMVIYAPVGLTEPEAFAKIILESAKKTTKNVLVCLMGESSECQLARGMLQTNSIPAFRFPEEAASTFMHIYDHYENLQLLYQTPEEIPPSNASLSHLSKILRRAHSEGRLALSLEETLLFLKAYGIPVARTCQAKTAKECLDFASQHGYPLTLKTIGFSLDVCSQNELPERFNEAVQRLRLLNRMNKDDSISVQSKTTDYWYQFSLSSHKDSQFGSVVCLRSGGILGHVLKDVSAGFPPLNQVLARQMLRGIKGMNDVHDEDRKISLAVVDEIIARFSQLVIDFPQIREISIDSLLVLQKGAIATDAQISIDSSRIMRQGAEFHDHYAIAPYPQKYVMQYTLKNDQKVTIRPIKPEDEDRLNDFFKSLSRESIRFRFFEIIKEMSHDTLSRYCNLDYDREIAVVAMSNSDGKLLGVSRLIIELDEKSAEFAITIGDSWQGQGLGSKLVDVIIDVARDYRLEKMHCLVDRENCKMINLCKKKGFKVKEADEFTIEVTIDPNLGTSNI